MLWRLLLRLHAPAAQQAQLYQPTTVRQADNNAAETQAHMHVQTHILLHRSRLSYLAVLPILCEA